MIYRTANQVCSTISSFQVSGAMERAHVMAACTWEADFQNTTQ